MSRIKVRQYRNVFNRVDGRLSVTVKHAPIMYIVTQKLISIWTRSYFKTEFDYKSHIHNEILCYTRKLSFEKCGVYNVRLFFILSSIHNIITIFTVFG